MQGGSLHFCWHSLGGPLWEIDFGKMSRRPWGQLRCQGKRGAGRGSSLCKGPGVLGGRREWRKGLGRPSEWKVVGGGTCISKTIPDVSRPFRWEGARPQKKPRKPALPQFLIYIQLHIRFLMNSEFPTPWRLRRSNGVSRCKFTVSFLFTLM